MEVTLYHDCKTHRYCNGDVFSLITCELLGHVASRCVTFIWYIVKHLLHENLCSITFYFEHKIDVIVIKCNREHRFSRNKCHIERGSYSLLL